MKKSIIYLGIAISCISNVCMASSSYSKNSLNDGNESSLLNYENYLRITPIVEESIFNPELNFIEKSQEEIIAIDNQIIESKLDKTIRPIYLEKTIEDIIYEDNLIIESEILKTSYPLDLNKINIDNQNFTNKIDVKKFVGMK